MKIEREEPTQVIFEVPDVVTVRHQLLYSWAISESNEDFDTVLRWWQGALIVLDNWKCELVPDPTKLDMDKVTDPAVAELVTWVGVQVRQHMMSLDTIKKK